MQNGALEAQRLQVWLNSPVPQVKINAKSTFYNWGCLE